ncbi:MAG: exodeoxyribonuclease VII large subunit [Gammaproteobacteria bacterium]
MRGAVPIARPFRDIYTVTRLNREARAILEDGFPPLWVEGEISNLARPASGHLYFSLKDAQCQVRCALFRSRNTALSFDPVNGMQVLARAQASLYEGRGDFQLIVEHLEPAGEGRLRLALEALKRRLQTEGLFSEEHKIALPALPRAVGVVTSPSGAAIRDVLSILKRRFPALPVVVYPVPVQGVGAAAEIARALFAADRRKDCDVLILARGGGSLEDLWAFNEEVVARAIYACELPVVTGIGHEIDFTIADLVADRRAATPSAAAELVSPDQQELSNQQRNLETRLLRALLSRVKRGHQALDWLSKRLVHPRRRLTDQSQRLDELWLRLTRAAHRTRTLKMAKQREQTARLLRHDPQQALALRHSRCRHQEARLTRAFAERLAVHRERLAKLGATLNAVSPLSTLLRGYAIVTSAATGRVVRDAAALRPGDPVTARFARGEADCEVLRTGGDLTGAEVAP